MRDEQLWPAMASWLHEIQNAYVEALSQQLGQEEMS